MSLVALVLAAALAAAAPASPSPTLSSSGPPPRDGAGCDGNTIQVDQCLADALTRVEAEHQRYLGAARAQARVAAADAGPTAALAARATAQDFDASETAWRAYRDAECRAVFDSWSGGTIRAAMEIGCRIRLTRLRTHTIWENWLTAMDRSPPLLPEPVVPAWR